MHALLITNDFPPIVSGISTYFYQLCKRQTEALLILAPRCPGAERFDAALKPRVLRRRWPVGESTVARLMKTLLNVFWMLVVCRRHRVEKIVCGQVLSNGTGGWLCRKLFGIPYAVFVYGSETMRFGASPLRQAMMRRVLDGASEVVTNSTYTLEEFRRFGVPPEKLMKLPPGVDTRFFAPGSAIPERLGEFAVNGERLLLTVGRLDERKGHHLVLETLHALAEEVPELHYVIVGSGREERRLRELVESLGLGDRVHFVGYVPDEVLPEFYRACDLFVLPNKVTQKDARLRGDYEGFGMVFLEAAACGKPVIAGASGGAPDAVVQGETGYLVPPDDPNVLGATIRKVLDDPDLAQRLGQEGRARAVREFDWDRLAERFSELLCC